MTDKLKMLPRPKHEWFMMTKTGLRVCSITDIEDVFEWVLFDDLILQYKVLVAAFAECWWRDKANLNFEGEYCQAEFDNADAWADYRRGLMKQEKDQ